MRSVPIHGQMMGRWSAFVEKAIRLVVAHANCRGDHAISLVWMVEATVQCDIYMLDQTCSFTRSSGRSLLHWFASMRLFEDLQLD